MGLGDLGERRQHLRDFRYLQGDFVLAIKVFLFLLSEDLSLFSSICRLFPDPKFFIEFVCYWILATI